MLVQAIKTDTILVNDSLETHLDKILGHVSNQSILAITSKVISLCEGRVVNKVGVDKAKLIQQEADKVLQTQHNPYGVYLTLKHNLLIPSAGIDESNAGDNYILYPRNPQASAERIWHYLRKNNIQDVGVLVTDSHSTMLRAGVMGCALGWCGFKPLHSYIGQPDIFKQPLKMTHINVLDALAAAAVFEMGEGNEKTPIAIIQNASKVEFVNRPPTESELKSVLINMDEDLYAPLLTAVEWS